MYWVFSHYPQVNAAFFWWGAAFIQGRHLLVVLLPSVCWIEGGIYTRAAFNWINMVYKCISDLTPLIISNNNNIIITYMFFTNDFDLNMNKRTTIVHCNMFASLKQTSSTVYFLSFRLWTVCCFSSPWHTQQSTNEHMSIISS